MSMAQPPRQLWDDSTWVSLFPYEEPVTLRFYNKEDLLRLQGTYLSITNRYCLSIL